MPDNDILKRDFSEEFISLMKKSIETSYYKYGHASKTYPELAHAVDSIETRLKKYLETGNREWLVDVANFAMLEFMYPSHPNAHYKGTDSSESPGITNGISYKEMMEELDEHY